MLNLALNACFSNCFSQNGFIQKKYFDDVLFCCNRLAVKELFHSFSFLLNQLMTKVFFQHCNFLPNRFSKKKYIRCLLFYADRFGQTFSNRLNEKLTNQLCEKIKKSISLFFVRSVRPNFYKSITNIFVQHDQQQKKYFGHTLFLPSQCITKHKNDSVKKLKKIVRLNALNSYFSNQKIEIIRFLRKYRAIENQYAESDKKIIFLKY